MFSPIFLSLSLSLYGGFQVSVIGFGRAKKGENDTERRPKETKSYHVTECTLHFGLAPDYSMWRQGDNPH